MQCIEILFDSSNTAIDANARFGHLTIAENNNVASYRIGKYPMKHTHTHT